MLPTEAFTHNSKLKPSEWFVSLLLRHRTDRYLCAATHACANSCRSSRALTIITTTPTDAFHLIPRAGAIFSEHLYVDALSSYAHSTKGGRGVELVLSRAHRWPELYESPKSENDWRCRCCDPAGRAAISPARFVRRADAVAAHCPCRFSHQDEGALSATSVSWTSFASLVRLFDVQQEVGWYPQRVVRTCIAGLPCRCGRVARV